MCTCVPRVWWPVMSNAAKREAGLVPRRFATREELVGLLRELGEELGRVPTAKDLEARRGSMAAAEPRA